MKKFGFLLFLLLTAAMVFADGTQTWEQTKFDDFEKGTVHGVAISSEGALRLAPEFAALYTSPSTYLWALAADRAGNVYAAAGAPARIFRITPSGQAETIFEPSELQVQALVEREGVIYAATSPDGKVYKIEKSAPAEKTGKSEWKASVFFDPKTKYIWALAMDQQGALYVGTGDQGQIFKVTPAGEGAVFFQSGDAHIRSLAFDRNGNLIAGTDGSGLIYRISPAGEGFVLYSAPKKEITALAVDAQNNIFAAGAGQKRAPQPAAAPAPQPANPPANSQAAPAGPNVPAPVPTGGSDIYEISADNAPKTIWSSRDALVYALAIAPAAGRQPLIAGTGNKGQIFSVGEDGSFTLLAQASANQVTGFAPAPSGGVYATTSNLGKVFRLAAAGEREGSFESDVFDAHLFSRWGRAEFRGRGPVELEARSGNVENPDRDWSPWSRISFSGPDAGQIQAPAARFLQWRAVLKSANPQPQIDSVTVNYLSKNVAPVVDSVEVQVAGAPPAAEGQNTPSPASGAATAQNQQAQASAAAAHDHTVTVRWTAHDDNDDQLVYRIYFRGDGESNWRPLEHNDLTEKSYSFDGGLLPDGGYTIKVVASDAPSHSPDDALAGSQESPHFEIDTTSPQLQDLHAALENGVLHVTFRAADSFSAIRRAEYSLDAGDWQFIAPVGELSDSKAENYDFNIPLPPVSPAPTSSSGGKKQPAAEDPANPNEHSIAVRAYDRFGNVASAKIIVH